MSIRLQRSLPLNAKFGFHYGHFAELPTIEEFFRFQSRLPHLKNQLYALDIADVMSLLNKAHGCVFELEIPVLGFTDPALDYDLNPWFAIPIALNGFVANAQSPELSKAQVWVKDLVDNEYPLLQDKMCRVDYEQIFQKLSTGFYTTLNSVCYRYTREQILEGKDLAVLPQGEYYRNKILLFLPKANIAFKLKILIRNKEGIEVFKNELYLSAAQENEVSVETKSQWRGMSDNGTLQIDYCVSEKSKLEGAQHVILHLLLPENKGLKWMLFGSSEWTTTHEEKQSCLTQYFGLTTQATLDILKQLIPYSYFRQQITKTKPKDTKGLSLPINDFSTSENAAQILYQYVMSGILNRSIPLYALSEYIKNKRKIYELLEQININHWSLSDQIVFKHYLFQLSFGQITAERVLDSLDSCLSFGPTHIEGSIIVKTSGVALAKNPNITAKLEVLTRSQIFPLENGFVFDSFAPTDLTIQHEDIRLKGKDL
ncbi:hypothetical protein CC99x_000185 [Candidatus Berkiella cookevillensis]|uniref:Uncharacterized protein n=1 Tax=Candidatus Berkiella cookevillensis TaxID=437022 RepID=A0A0Q9YQT2_9GAMM|nr:hypothetical protein [Candidatus Berkiella cookevillensis]MCS5707313.1 hypothetical protein [Candidatus Berkiella cookevillensis]